MSRHFVALAICIPLLAAGVRATAQTDRLPSWNAGAAKWSTAWTACRRS
jgi:hypothetical protein